MSQFYRAIRLVALATCLVNGIAFAQDSSLGDLARRQREQRGQSQAVPGKVSKTSRVITDEDMPEHSAETSEAAAGGEEREPHVATAPGKAPAESWKSRILAQKNQIASLQSQLNSLNGSIRFAPANCVVNCAARNEKQLAKQQQAERMQAQLEDQKKQLQDMQESARREGYGSSVYDP
jgi:hypothetical protein